MGRRGGRQGSGRLGDLLRRYRQRLGLSQEELAERVTPALSVASIGNIERGRTRPYRQALLSLSAALRKGRRGGRCTKRRRRHLVA